MLEAMPFMVFGALVGGLVEAFVSSERLTAMLPRRGWVTVMLAGGLGVFLPVCECAVVPVVRRLMGKGLPVPAAIAYLLGGPIVNPIVAVSTALAYGLDWRVVGLRAGLGYVIAVGVALTMGRVFRHQPILRSRQAESHHPDEPREEQDHAEHAHTGHNDVSCAFGSGHAGLSPKSKIAIALRHAADDFLMVGHYLVLGAFIAALAQTYIDRKAFLFLTEHPVLPSLLMIALAILLNLCSEADAFIAASFRGLVPLPAQMAFMLTGPMLDLKLLLMYQEVFRKRAIVALAVFILLAVFLAALGMKLFGVELR
jgi:uncharacterized membrane protein YraQ (UPF0718 family)